MAAYFAAPIAFPVSALSGTYLATNPLNNILSDRAGLVWRSTATTDTFSVALGGAAVDTIALWQTNMAANDSVKVIFCATAAGGSPTFTQTYAGEQNKTIILPQTYSTPFVRFEFTRTSGIPYVEISKLVLAKRLNTDGISQLAEQTFEDFSPSNSGPSWETYERYGRVQSWKAMVEGINQDEFMTNWYPFLMNVGQSLPFIFVPDYPSAYLSQNTLLARFTSPVKATWITGVDRRIEMQIRGIV